MSEELDNVLQLIDEDGQEQDFEVLDLVELNDEEYMLLTPVVEEEYGEDDEVPVLIVRLIPGEEEDELEAITDQKLMEEIFNKFLESLEEEDDEE